jgi:hypothetical protein
VHKRTMQCKVSRGLYVVMCGDVCMRAHKHSETLGYKILRLRFKLGTPGGAHLRSLAGALLTSMSLQFTDVVSRAAFLWIGDCIPG